MQLHKSGLLGNFPGGFVSQNRVPRHNTHERQNLQEHHGKCPDLPVFAGSCPLAKVPSLGTGIISILVDSADDEFDLIAVEKLPVVPAHGNVREIDEEHPAKHSCHYCHQAKDDKNPPPALEASQTILCHMSISPIFIIEPGIGESSPSAADRKPEYLNIPQRPVLDRRRRHSASAYQTCCTRSR